MQRNNLQEVFVERIPSLFSNRQNFSKKQNYYIIGIMQKILYSLTVIGSCLCIIK